MKRLYSGTATEIEILHAMLDEHGIKAVILNESTAAVAGAIPFLATLPQLWIEDDADGQRAGAIIAEYLAKQQQDTIARKPWQCPHCGQIIDGQFTTCWSCTLTDDDDPRSNRDAKCDECGYSLWGLPERRCPECGSDF